MGLPGNRYIGNTTYVEEIIIAAEEVFSPNRNNWGALAPQRPHQQHADRQLPAAGFRSYGSAIAELGRHFCAGK